MIIKVMLKTIWDFVKKGLLGVLIMVYIVAWVLNSIKGTHFDLPQLLELIKWMVANHLIDSGLNTNIPLVDQLRTPKGDGGG